VRSPARIFALFVGATILGAGACSNDASPVTGAVTLQAIVDPEPPDCSSLPDRERALSRGRLDVGLSVRYLADVVIENHAAADDEGSAEDIAIATGADVTLSEGDAQLATFSFSVVAAGSADPGALGVASFELVPPSIGGAIYNQIHDDVLAGRASAKTIDARVVLTGTFAAGGSWRSDEIDFPLDVCLGCSVEFPVDSTDVTFATPNCLRAGEPTIWPCRPGQEEPTDCRLCQGNPVCSPCAVDADCVRAGAGQVCGPSGGCL